MSNVSDQKEYIEELVKIREEIDAVRARLEGQEEDGWLLVASTCLEDATEQVDLSIEYQRECLEDMEEEL